MDESETGQMVLKKVKWTYFDAYLWQTMWNHAKTSQELWMLSSVTLNCQVTKIVINPGFQQIITADQMSQLSQVSCLLITLFKCLYVKVLSVNESLSEWQCHPLSCFGQLTTRLTFPRFSSGKVASSFLIFSANVWQKMKIYMKILRKIRHLDKKRVRWPPINHWPTSTFGASRTRHS